VLTYLARDASATWQGEPDAADSAVHLQLGFTVMFGGADARD
jgi:hypothetical protein